MARNPVQSLTVASGVDLTSDPVTMPLNRAQSIINFQNERLGLLRTDLRLVNILPAPMPATIDGVYFYYRAVAINPTTGTLPSTIPDELLYVSGGNLYFSTPSDDLFYIPYSAPFLVSGGVTGYAGGLPFFQGPRVRFIALQSEVIMVQEGGILPLRYYDNNPFFPNRGFYRAGIQPPTEGDFGSTPTPNMQTRAVAAGASIGPGTWGYKLTWEDERGRESSPTPVRNQTITNVQGVEVTLWTGHLPPPAEYSGDNIVTFNIYRNTLGAPDVFYRIARGSAQPSGIVPDLFVVGALEWFYNPSSVAYDEAPDSAIVAGPICPNPGENDPPLPASVICLWKNRVLLNDISDTSTLQISNTLSPTQFTSISLGIVTDGERTLVGTDQGDPITAIVDFGSYAAIFKRRACFFLSGNDITDFQIQPIYTRGCLSPDSAVRCDNQVLFLSDDGVYAASYGNGELVGKISKEIEAQLLKQPMTARETSYAWFVDNAYHLQVGQTTYVYQFDVLAWVTWQLGLRFNYGGGDAGIIGEVVPPVSTGGSQGGTVTPPATATITNPGC